MKTRLQKIHQNILVIHTETMERTTIHTVIKAIHTEAIREVSMAIRMANPYGNPYGNAGQNNGNPYGGSGQNNQYSYNSNPYTNGQTGPQVGPNGKKLGVGFGVASLVLGIISLLCFCSGVNVILAILAIVFGVIQIVTCEKKGMAIGGIATAVISVVLLVITWGLLFSNAAFMDMMQEEMQNDFEDDEDMQQFFEQYGIDMNGEDDTL